MTSDGGDNPEPLGVDPEVADAVARAALAFRVSIDAGPELAVFATRDALAGVTDPAELRMVAAVAVAAATAVLVPAAGIPEGPLRWAVDLIAVEIAWRAS